MKEVRGANCCNQMSRTHSVTKVISTAVCFTQRLLTE